MKIDANMGYDPGDIADIRERAVAAEAAGYDGIWSVEAQHDPFLPLVLAAEHTERLEVGTGIAVAFARTPMSVAYAADDLQRHSGGRFVLGLGSQIKPHVERRFAMPWSRPAARMREFITALRAIWSSWQTGERLAFEGEFYRHTLMTPFFSPGPNPHGPPRVFLAAVGEAMTRVAGEVADGLLVHGFTTPRYLREVTLPRLEESLAASGRDRREFELSYPAFVVTGADEREQAAAADEVRRQIAFYGSTPAYKPVLALHGWEELADELVRLSKENTARAWARMPELIDDDVLDTFAVVAEPGGVAGELRARYGGAVDRLGLSVPDGADPGAWRRILDDLRSRP